MIPSPKLMELDRACCDAIAATPDMDDTTEVIELPVKKLKQIRQSCCSVRNALSDCMSSQFSLEEEITKNRFLYERLHTLVNKCGFSICKNKLEGRGLPATQFGQSKNDHCLCIRRDIFKVKLYGVALFYQHQQEVGTKIVVGLKMIWGMQAQELWNSKTRYML